MMKDIADANAALDDYHLKEASGEATQPEEAAAKYLKEVLQEMNKELLQLQSAQASVMGDGGSLVGGVARRVKEMREKDAG